MEQRIKEAFDAVQADPARVAAQKRRLLAQMRQGPRPRRRWVPMLALVCCLLAVCGLGARTLILTPTTVLSIDVNPSLEMAINRFDRVIALKGYNDDGAALAGEVDVFYMNYEEAVDRLLANETISTCLAEGEELTIAVVQSDVQQGEDVLAYVSQCTAHHAGAHCYAMDADDAEMAAAHEAGLSCGKYRAWRTLQALDPSITAEDAQQMTMREIREAIARLEGTDSATSAGQSNGGGGNGNGGGHQHQHGGHHGQ